MPGGITEGGGLRMQISEFYTKLVSILTLDMIAVAFSKFRGDEAYVHAQSTAQLTCSEEYSSNKGNATYS